MVVDDLSLTFDTSIQKIKRSILVCGGIRSASGAGVSAAAVPP